jgi:putative ABC transport system permease protein
MIISYLKLSLYLLFKARLYTLINVAGLAFSLACCLLIALFIRHELSYDRFFSKAENIYRVSMNNAMPGGSQGLSASFGPLAGLLQQDFPEIVRTGRIAPRTYLLRSDEQVFFENSFLLADRTILQMFDFQWLQGNPDSALAGPADVVLTTSLARRYFGDEDPLGKTVSVEDAIELRVTGVIADMPQNTHFRGSAIASMEILDVIEPEVLARNGGWFNAAFYTYIELQPGAEVSGIERQLDAFAARHLPVYLDTRTTLVLDRLKDIHLTPKTADMKPGGSKEQLVIFTAVAMAVLIIASINFMNLTTARSTLRAREVGLRKTFGADRAQLLRQFLGESCLLSMLAVGFALVLAELLLPLFQSFLNTQFSFDYSGNPLFYGMVLLAILMLGLLSGWYPALVLSSFKPARVLNASRLFAGLGLSLRSVLVVIQFSLAIIMIASATVIFLQMRHITSLDMGFVTEQILVIRTSDYGSDSRMGLLKNELLKSPEITHVTSSYSTPLRDRNRISTVVSSETDQSPRLFAYLPVDFNYFETYGIELIAGRLFDQNLTTDLMGTPDADNKVATGKLVINEKAAMELGWSAEEAIGKLIFRNGSSFAVIGVVGNTVETARADLNPSLYVVPADMRPGTWLSIRLMGNDLAAALAHVDASWQSVNPDEPLNKTFLDETVNGLYAQETRHMQLAFYFSTVAIVISSLGLLGLAAFASECRTREIGVRKVMGGSVWSIVLLLTNDFSKLVLFSNLIAWPVAYFAMSRWLENFVYRIDLTPLIFIGSGLIALCIAWVTVGGTAAKAASAKPVLALRYE